MKKEKSFPIKIYVCREMRCFVRFEASTSGQETGRYFMKFFQANGVRFRTIPIVCY